MPSIHLTEAQTISTFNFIIIIVYVSGNIKTKAILDVETKTGYWLTIYAQDHGIVPLSNKVEVRNFYFSTYIVP